MKKQDIYLWIEKNKIPLTMVEEINEKIWPIYNGKTSKGEVLINDLSKPEERVRLKVVSAL
jgi:hypothetical protein